MNLEQIIESATAAEAARKQQEEEKLKQQEQEQRQARVFGLLEFAKDRLTYQGINLIESFNMRCVEEAQETYLEFAIGGANYTDFVDGGRRFRFYQLKGMVKHLQMQVHRIVNSSTGTLQYSKDDEHRIERAEQFLALFKNFQLRWENEKAQRQKQAEQLQLQQQLAAKYEAQNTAAELELVRLEAAVDKLNQQLQQKEAEFQEYKDNFVATSKAAQWQWPEGKILTLYKWEWCKGGFIDDDGTHLEYDEGWSLKDQPDENGYVPLLRERVYDGSNRNNVMIHFSDAREVKVPKSAIVTRYKFGAIAQLPDTLKVREYLEIKYWQCYEPYAAIFKKQVTEQNLTFTLKETAIQECDEAWFSVVDRIPDTEDITIEWWEEKHFEALGVVPLQELQAALQ